MAKTPLQIYVRVEKDCCTNRQMSLGCGAPRKSHPMNMSGVFHEYQGGATEFVYPTQDEKRKIYEQLKEEFGV